MSKKNHVKVVLNRVYFSTLKWEFTSITKRMTNKLNIVKNKKVQIPPLLFNILRFALKHERIINFRKSIITLKKNKVAIVGKIGGSKAHLYT